MFWTAKKAGYRCFQAGLGTVARLLYWRRPLTEDRPGAIAMIPQALAADGLTQVLLVTDRGVLAAGLLEPILALLEQAGVAAEVFSEVQANPAIPEIMAGLARFEDTGCQGLVAVGGGSAMDCSKMIAALAAVPHGSPQQLGGLFRVTLLRRRPLPPLYCVPTTAGTGSETTIVAVVSDPETHKKYTVMDFPLLPKRVFLDAELCRTLPPSVTAQSGMDALTHAVEACLNGFMATDETRAKALEATALIFRYLPRAYADGQDMEARAEMLTAAYLAGQAFGRATVGYAHAIAHAVGGLSGLPHGALTGIVLPPLLEWYGPSAWKRLAELADAAGVGEAQMSEAGKARAFIRAVYALRRELGLPEALPLMDEAQVALVCERAMREANPLYPVPRLMNVTQCHRFVQLLMRP